VKVCSSQHRLCAVNGGEVRPSRAISRKIVQWRARRDSNSRPSESKNLSLASVTPCPSMLYQHLVFQSGIFSGTPCAPFRNADRP
jgi:hypothetical protein